MALISGNQFAKNMTKREQLAALVMQALVSSDSTGGTDYAEIAEHAVFAADALIAELAKETQP